ncbi:MAG: DUF3601 domain-containing protein [Helicobacteraceae bacterium]|jgi:hypothetical protein|nr:DUF3601 domain-containing protein [Helicobacteraceae bacterium]
MIGPKKMGFWSKSRKGNAHQFLRPSKRYRVIKSFQDHDEHIHPEGEEWIFLGYSFLPYDDGLLWFVSFDEKREWSIPMRWNDSSQSAIIDRLSEYICPVVQ